MGENDGGDVISSSNDWRMVRMYELMEDFEEVLSRAPITICGQQLTLSMGGIKDLTSTDAEEQETKHLNESVNEIPLSRPNKRHSGNRDANDSTLFATGNCLSSGCCYTSSSTESDTVRPDQSKAASKFKKQRERLLSRPTL